MNPYVKAKLVEKGWLKDGADDAAAQEALSAKMASGELSLPELMKWTEEATAKATARDDAANKIADRIGAALNDKFDKLLGALSAKSAVTATVQSADDIADKLQTKSGQVDPEDIMRRSGAPRVKKASECYSHTKTAVTYSHDVPNHPMKRAGMPVRYFKGSMDPSLAAIPTEINALSEAELAKCGAFIKHRMAAAGASIRLNEHEQQLVKEVAHEDAFVGDVAGRGIAGARKLTDFEVKAVLDDSGSGGQEAVPEYFDTAIITPPLLHGELFPYVNVINVPRGSSADGFSIGTPTFVSTASGSAVTPFTTTGFVTAFDTTFFPATCAFEWGMDFESDSVPNFAATVIAQIAQEHLRWLDEQIAIGDGTTEPQGLAQASGTSVSAQNGTAGDLTYNDALNLAFGIPKEARNEFGGGSRVRYVMNDTDYKKFLQIVTGVTGDTRPLFGMRVKDYMLGDYNVSVQNNITVGNIYFANLAAYRMYRRQGISFLIEEAGSTLRLANKKLLVARTRWGGKLTLQSTHLAKMTNADIYS